MDQQQPDAEARSATPGATAGATPATKRSGDWGSVAIGTQRVSLRLVLTVAGILVWLGLMFLETGAGGIAALRVSLLFLLPLVAIGSLTRSVSLALIGQFVLVGGLALSIAWVLISLFTTVVPNLYAPIRDFVVPPIEEATKFAPLVLILWFRRRATAWTFGATDLLLMGAAIGTGFGLVELAYTTAPGSSTHSVPLLPITEIYHSAGRNAGVGWGHLVVGHAVWAAIGGGMLGIALFLRGRGRVAIVVAAAGVAWTTLDHIADNYSAVHPGALADLLLLLTANGWLSLLFFLAVIAAAIGVDWWVVRTCVPAIPALATPPLGGAGSLAASWRFRVGRRALAYTIFKGRRAPVARRPEAVEAAVAVLRRMFYGRTGVAAAPATRPAAGGIQS